MMETIKDKDGKEVTISRDLYIILLDAFLQGVKNVRITDTNGNEHTINMDEEFTRL